MKIAVINGSPKGDNSITLQTVLFLEKKFPEHEFLKINASAKIKAYEKDMSEALGIIGSADLILFSYPVYTFLVPSQLHRFIELMKEAAARGKIDLRGKRVTQLTTSKHFYDVTAHAFVRENCEDLGMKCIRGLSADMEDLPKKRGRKDAVDFLKFVEWSMEKGYYEGEEAPDGGSEGAGAFKSAEPYDAHSGKPVVIVTDAGENDTELNAMIERFRELLPRPTTVVDLNEYEIKGGCLGCLRCASNGICVYRDGFSEMLRERVQTGCAIVYAFTVKDHSMGQKFKEFDDRQFCNGHRTVTAGSPVGYLVHGEYSKEKNLRTVLEARAEAGSNFLAGAASDEGGKYGPEHTERAIRMMADRLDYALRENYTPPSNFYGVGGMKIFRDLIYLMRGFMKEDHRFFKANGMYDFPHKRKGTSLGMYLVGAMMSSDKMRKKLGNKMNEGMLMPYKKVLDKADKGE